MFGTPTFFPVEYQALGTGFLAILQYSFENFSSPWSDRCFCPFIENVSPEI